MPPKSPRCAGAYVATMIPFFKKIEKRPDAKICTKNPCSQRAVHTRVASPKQARNDEGVGRHRLLFLFLLLLLGPLATHGIAQTKFHAVLIGGDTGLPVFDNATAALFRSKSITSPGRNRRRGG